MHNRRIEHFNKVKDIKKSNNSDKMSNKKTNVISINNSLNKKRN